MKLPPSPVAAYSRPFRAIATVPPVVVDRAGLLDLDQLSARAAVRAGRVLVLALELVDLDVSAVVREVDVELARPLVVGREGDREEARLDLAAADEPADVEERRALPLPVQDAHSPRPLGDEGELLRVARGGEEGGGVEARDLMEVDAAARLGRVTTALPRAGRREHRRRDQRAEERHRGERSSSPPPHRRNDCASGPRKWR